MHDSETRALVRAIVVLVAVSVVRWGWAQRAPADTPGGESVAPALLASSRDATDEADRRGEPLADGERIDPNRADGVQLDRLPGVGPATAGAIVAARDGGRVFRRPEDLLEVTGVGPATLERIRASLDFDAPPPPARTGAGGAAGRVDVNRADPVELQALPGVGPALAERIVEARKERMFSSVDDLTRVQGIGPATVARIRPHATVVGNR